MYYDMNLPVYSLYWPFTIILSELFLCKINNAKKNHFISSPANKNNKLNSCDMRFIDLLVIHQVSNLLVSLITALGKSTSFHCKVVLSLLQN